MSDGALAGIRVVDFGELVSAPFCARLFADFGADVIKVEPPGGDASRRLGPFPGDVPHPEKSGLFFINNTNKRSVICDVGTAAGRERFLQLLRGADVLIDNHPPAQMRSWGLDYATLAAANPALVVIAITPFGQTGPFSAWQGTDLNAFHLSGAGSRYCGRPGEAPLEQGTFAADYYGAIAGASWGLAALLGRERVGGGQLVDVSSAEAIAATFVGAYNVGGYAQDGVSASRTGVGMAQGAPATILPCRDGHVWVLALEPAQWDGLRRVMGNPAWADDPRFATMQSRARHAGRLYPLLEAWTRGHGKMDIMTRCQAAGCPVSAVFTVAEAAAQEHLAARQFFVDIEHPDLGTVRALGAPFKLPACPGGPSRPAPRLGEHDADGFGEGAGSAAAARRDAAAGGQGPVGAGRAPLHGLRVVNLGWVWAGPVAGQTLAWLGADVIKVESRARLDMTRHIPPFAEGRPDPERSLFNHASWAGNGSVSLDLKKPEARQLLLELVGQADLVIENFGPGVMAKLQLGYEQLRGARSDLVLLSMPATGLYGPLRDVRTYGLSLSSLTGIDSLTGYQGGGPVPMENAFSDPLAGIFAAFAALAALRHRDRSGQGQHVDFSQQEAMMQLLGPAYMDYALNGRVAGPRGNGHPLGAAAPHGVFPCRGEDRWISIAVAGDGEWQALQAALGRPRWAADYDTAARRLADVDRLHAQLAAWTSQFDDRALAERLQGHGVAAAPVYGVADLLACPHYRARGTFIEVRHPLGFAETLYGPYVKLSATPVEVAPGPLLGRDNERVFKGLLGLSDERYRRLVAGRVIY